MSMGCQRGGGRPRPRTTAVLPSLPTLLTSTHFWNTNTGQVLVTDLFLVVYGADTCKSHYIGHNIIRVNLIMGTPEGLIPEGAVSVVVTAVVW